MKVTGVLVPAGTYFLGDPCYCFNNEDWSVLLRSCDTFNQPIGEIRGHKVLAFDTAHGDGVYEGSDGFHYGVDAGLIGLVPEGAASKDCRGLCKKVMFDKEAVCTSYEGVLRFREIMINTNWEDEE